MILTSRYRYNCLLDKPALVAKPVRFTFGQHNIAEPPYEVS